MINERRGTWDDESGGAVVATAINTINSFNIDWNIVKTPFSWVFILHNFARLVGKPDDVMMFLKTKHLDRYLDHLICYHCNVFRDVNGFLLYTFTNYLVMMVSEILPKKLESFFFCTPSMPSCQPSRSPDPPTKSAPLNAIFYLRMNGNRKSTCRL